MAWLPTERLVLLNEAEPPLNVPIPICDDPSMKTIEPVGTPVPDCGETPAANVTLCPLVNCIADAERDVLVATFAGAATVTGTAADVDAEKFVSPEYTAVTECEPTLRLDVLNVAVPEEFNVPVPICVAPSLNFTEPVGTPDPDIGAIEAVKVTACPKVICAPDAMRAAFVVAIEEPAGMKTKTVPE